MIKKLAKVITLATLLMGINFCIFAQEKKPEKKEEFKPSVDFKGSRIALGYLDAQKDGTPAVGSFQMPDGKLRFNWRLHPEVTVVTRLDIPNASVAGGLDYMYVDYKNFLLYFFSPTLKDGLFNPDIRLGLFKLDLGEETWADNPVESAVLSNSAPRVTGTDEGLQLSQSYAREKLGVPLKWSLSLTNGNSEAGPDNTQGKALAIKVGVNPIPEVYISTSYYDSGDIGSGTAAIHYAGLRARPTGATKWERSIFEIDLRYDIKPGKENRLSPGGPAFSDSKALIRMAYGTLKDDIKQPANITGREGSYYFIEGLYNQTNKTYLAARYSVLDLDKDVFATLNGITNTNKYTRTSCGFGYRLTDNTHIKGEYAQDKEERKAPNTDAKNNRIGVLFTNRF